MAICPVCKKENLPHNEICPQCGYSDKDKEVFNKDFLRAYLSKLNKSKKWKEELKTKSRINSIQINKHGFSSTNPDLGGWSIRKTAKLLRESVGTTSTHIKIACALDKYPELMSCRNKSEAKKRLDQIENGVALITASEAFKNEEMLQDYMQKNWEKTPFSNEWNLEGQSQYGSGKIDTQEIGELDLLARHVSEPRLLVVELKKDQTSDETVGQILRYMGWIKEHYAQEDEKVEGLIIAAIADKRMRYALACISNINMKIYRLTDGKIEFSDPEVLFVKDDIENIFKKLSKEQKEQLLFQLKNM
jgi:hypothetical protein